MINYFTTASVKVTFFFSFVTDIFLYTDPRKIYVVF